MFRFYRYEFWRWFFISNHTHLYGNTTRKCFFLLLFELNILKWNLFIIFAFGNCGLIEFFSEIFICNTVLIYVVCCPLKTFSIFVNVYKYNSYNHSLHLQIENEVPFHQTILLIETLRMTQNTNVMQIISKYENYTKREKKQEKSQLFVKMKAIYSVLFCHAHDFSIAILWTKVCVTLIFPCVSCSIKTEQVNWFHSYKQVWFLLFFLSKKENFLNFILLLIEQYFMNKFPILMS